MGVPRSYIEQTLYLLDKAEKTPTLGNFSVPAPVPAPAPEPALKLIYFYGETPTF